MNAHPRIRAVKPADPQPAFDLEDPICHLAREARAAQIMADELISQLRSFASVDCNGEQIRTLTAEAQEMLTDFASRVAIAASDLRVRYYGGAR